MLRYLPFLLILALWIYAFIDCLNTPENEVRKLPKVAWVIIVLLFGEVLIGPIAWLTVGRPRKAVGGAGGTGGGIAGAFGGRRGGGGWVAPDDNPEFLKSLRKDPRPDGAAGPGSTSSPDAGPASDPDSGSGSAPGTKPGAGSGPASGTGSGSGADSGPASGTDPGAADRKPETDRRDDEGPQGPQRG
ncbi:PLD nuclease N-terminal domain-containing protein [Streptomyces buecherae]|uniref:PLD nuclease N-terminal domain-containing protein n=1 Tax=Streptomyces buecherae TaxID=2763006 RepID=UPI0037983A0A